jgi:hypothetical protein
MIKGLWAIASVIAALAAGPSSAATITKWDFNSIGLVGAPFNSPAPTTGSGTATGTFSTLGNNAGDMSMTNTYNGGNTESDDVVSTSGTANPAFTENTWRIRGVTHNGWATKAAGANQYCQGIQLTTSTVGYSNIQFSFDWYSTTQGIRDLQFQYNTNVANPAGWTNFGGTSPTGTYIATSNDYYNAPGSPTITVDLSSIAGANNDPNLGVRLVSAFDSTGHIPGDYASAALSSGQTVIYNNSSGNWRFANLAFSGTATSVPEPASIALAGIGLIVGLLWADRRSG